MAVRWFYMTPEATAFEFTAGTSWHPLQGLRSGAEEASAEVSLLTVNDPNSEYDFLAWRRVYCIEDAAPEGEQVIYMGFISNIPSVKKMGTRYPLARVWELSLSDLNYMIIPRVFAAGDFIRPDENDLERKTGLLASDYIDHLDDNTDYQDTTGGVALNARDFKGQTPYEVLHDMCEASNRNVFVMYLESEGPPDFDIAERELAVWYASVNADRYESTIRLSNALADIDLDWRDPSAVTFALHNEGSLHPDPQRIFSQGEIEYDGGRVRVSDSDIAELYTRRDTIMSFPNVTNATLATNRGARMLAAGGTPKHRIAWGYVCSAHHINKIMQGMKFEYKATHLGGLTDSPDYTSFVWVRAVTRQIDEIAPGTYFVSGEAVPIVVEEPPAPTSCSAIAAAIEIQDSGKQSGSSPEGALIPAAGANPRIVISAVCFANNGTAVGDTLTEAGAMTLVDSIPSSPGYDHTLGAWAYSTSTSAITPLWTWNPSGRTNRWRQVSFEIPTAATAPEQTAVSTSGTTTTLPDPATSGNLLVLIRMLQPPVASAGWNTNPTGFTLKGVYDVSDYGSEGQTIEVWTKCADGTEEAVYSGQSSYFHFVFLSEWELS